MITKFDFKSHTIKSYAIRKLTPLECFRLMGVRNFLFTTGNDGFDATAVMIEYD